MARKKKRTKKSIDAERRRKREWARRQRKGVKVDAVDSKKNVDPIIEKPKRLELSADELAQPIGQAAEETYRAIINAIRVRVKNNEKVTGEELKLIKQILEDAELAKSELKPIANDQIENELERIETDCLAVAKQILGDKHSPAAQRMDAARFCREWKKENEEPDEDFEIEAFDPSVPIPTRTVVTEKIVKLKAEAV